MTQILRGLSVSKKHIYDLEKVKKAIAFVKSANRKTSAKEYIEMYNYLKDKNITVTTICKACGLAKYINAIENYAKYGYLTLINSGGYTAKDFEENETEEDETSEQGEVNTVTETETETVNTVTETNDEETEETVNEETQPTKKRGRPKKRS